MFSSRFFFSFFHLGPCNITKKKVYVVRILWNFNRERTGILGFHRKFLRFIFFSYSSEHFDDLVGDVNMVCRDAQERWLAWKKYRLGEAEVTCRREFFGRIKIRIFQKRLHSRIEECNSCKYVFLWIGTVKIKLYGNVYER